MLSLRQYASVRSWRISIRAIKVDRPDVILHWSGNTKTKNKALVLINNWSKCHPDTVIDTVVLSCSTNYYFDNLKEV